MSGHGFDLKKNMPLYVGDTQRALIVLFELCVQQIFDPATARGVK
jgi:hypothetical protein